ncbi:MAG: putative peptidoglycan glycosyltransferase FtsW [Alphaproteobacteria bacterium]
MNSFARTDTSTLGRWWWTVDHWLLGALAALIFVGALLTLAASPPVAERVGLDSFHFVKRQWMILPVAVMIMVGVSLLSPQNIRRTAVVVFVASVGLLVLTLLVGPEIKGARRWLPVMSFSLQPSEIAKPAFAVVTAWMFAEHRLRPEFPGYRIGAALLMLMIGLLVLQPDLGMTVVVSTVWFTQLFAAGLPMIFVILLGILGIGGLVGAYFLLPHVASRIDRFLDPAAGDSYQINRSLEAFANGGIFGRGPGEGVIKTMLPDAHADFIFSVAGEEFGLIACLLLVALFAFVVIRGLGRLLQDQNFFVMLAGTGLVVMFGVQALVNMGSSLHLLPTKGMTLPFISYGGSSLIGLAFAMGMVLGLTRRRPHQGGSA